jgi:transposase
MARPINSLSLNSDQRKELRRIINRPKATQREVRRAWIILHRADGVNQESVAAMLRINRPVVALWEKRFRQKGLAGLAETGRSGRKPTLASELKNEIITEATRPPAGRTRWSTRTMARAKGVSVSTVHKLWSSNDIKPHLTRTFKLSRDPHFEAKFWDVIGLYLNPPDRALVLCCDERSQCQALERTQSGLPLGMGHICTKTHDYIRHGTLTLFAALSYLDGKIIRQVAAQHTHQEWLGFLKQIDWESPDGLTLHLIIDNYATHKHPAVKRWLKWRNERFAKAHGVPRMVMHFTPTSSSWMNLVERFFRDLTEDTIREGSFGSVKELETAIFTYLNERNLSPKRYVWKAKGEEILAKIMRAREKLKSQNSIV